jgi:peptide/nickel transport system permease protein
VRRPTALATLGRTRGRGGSRGSFLPRVLPAALLLLLALAGPWLAPYALDEPVTVPYAEPGGVALLGGDQLGRDVLTRVLAGGRELVIGALIVAVLETVIAAVLGVAGVLRPAVGHVVDRVADVLMLLPAVLGTMLITLSWPGGGRVTVLLAAVVIGVPYAIRLVAGAAASVVGSGYVEAAVAGGERTWFVVVREIVPNLRSTLVALFGLRFVAAVYVIATAGFLQVGADLSAADWALMVRENAPGILLNPWAVVVPSAAIGLLAVTVNVAAARLAPDYGRKAVTLQ